MFRGSYTTRVDEKGRLKLPADFKRLIDEKYGARFFLTSDDGETAQLWPMQEWEKKETKLAAIPDMDPLKKKLLARIGSYGREVEMDAQGRVLIHPRLREKAKLAEDVIILGSQTYLQLVNLAAHESSLEEELTDDEKARLAANYGF